jgi:hypothetical protein
MNLNQLEEKLEFLETFTFEWHAKNNKYLECFSSNKAGLLLITSIKVQPINKPQNEYHVFDKLPKAENEKNSLKKYDIPLINPNAPMGSSLVMIESEKEI